MCHNQFVDLIIEALNVEGDVEASYSEARTNAWWVKQIVAMREAGVPERIIVIRIITSMASYSNEYVAF